MPDLDILSKGVPSCFHVSYRLIRGGADDEHVLRGCRRGLSLALKRGGGVPGLSVRAGLIAFVGAGGNLHEAVSRSQRLLVTEGGTRHAHLAHKSLQRILAGGNVPSSIDEAEHRLANCACREVLDHLLFSRVSVESRALSMTDNEFQDYKSRLMTGLEQAFSDFERQLVADPSGGSVQTPVSPRGAIPSTEALLSEVVG